MCIRDRLKHIPYPELAARLRRGDTLADAAEYFCVTEEDVYKRQP